MYASTNGVLVAGAVGPLSQRTIPHQAVHRRYSSAPRLHPQSEPSRYHGSTRVPRDFDDNSNPALRVHRNSYTLYTKLANRHHYQLYVCNRLQFPTSSVRTNFERFGCRNFLSWSGRGSVHL